ncbi:MAG TPA: gamma-glutamylcyclotransferase [Stellaceae bacterium]|nr:gamma-glutamylcyclotransferase [Stellaceae bacterium]
MGRLTAAPGYVSIYPVDPMPAAIAALRSGAVPVWIFAYGSLMWNPEFPFDEARRGRLHGFHRRFCLYSRDYRGTPEEPGLVLGLDRGGSCHGIAYRLAAARTAEALDYIWAREMTGRVYTMRRVAVRTREGPVAAHACIVRRESPDYAGRLPLDEVARLLARAVGGRGSGRDYLTSTLRHLDRLAIREASLQRIASLVAQLPEAAAPQRPEAAQ